MPPQLPGGPGRKRLPSRGSAASGRQVYTPSTNMRGQSTSGLLIRAHRLWPLVGLSHHWAEKTPMMKGPLKLARNMEGRTKRDNLSVVWTYNTIHSTKYVTLSKRHLAPACTLAVPPRMKCARFTSRRCVRRGAAYRSQPLRTVTGLSILGRTCRLRIPHRRGSFTAGNFRTGPAREQDTDYTPTGLRRRVHT